MLLLVEGLEGAGQSTGRQWTLGLFVCFKCVVYLWLPLAAPDGPVGLVQVGVVGVTEVTGARLQQEAPLGGQSLVHVIQQADGPFHLVVIQAALHHGGV